MLGYIEIYCWHTGGSWLSLVQAKCLCEAFNVEATTATCNQTFWLLCHEGNSLQASIKPQTPRAAHTCAILHFSSAFSSSHVHWSLVYCSWSSPRLLSSLFTSDCTSSNNVFRSNNIRLFSPPCKKKKKSKKSDNNVKYVKFATRSMIQRTVHYLHVCHFSQKHFLLFHPGVFFLTVTLPELLEPLSQS